uniref:Uncharacterized protein n=1 Tax=Opuntia streptacantha TaxID=393608 RepID=A0A7C8YHK3_OPUST
MFGFGDELLIQSYRLPWLIWIQILVTFLLTLLILLAYFDFFAIEDSSPTSDSLSSTASPPLERPSTCSARTQEPMVKERERVAGNHDAWAEIATSTSNRTQGADDNSETDGSSVEDLTHNPMSERLYHPCRFLDLAKEAFLKCLGLDSSLRDSPPRQQRHED